MSILKDSIDAVMGRRPFDLLIENVRIVNVFNEQIEAGSIGIVGSRIVYAGEALAGHTAAQTLDGKNRFALPGFVDSHMHLESSMLQPVYFAEIVVPCGTTTVAADPHEIANVLGLDGVRLLVETTRGLPLRVLIFAPSTIPSAPGFEDGGFLVDGAAAAALLNMPGIAGLGEVMDFNGVAAADNLILSVIETAKARGVLLDGHVSALSGQKLQAFRATGIDSDHTLGTVEKLREELALGFTVQIQESMLNADLVKAMNETAVSDRICLVTDDVPLPRLMKNGHLNYVVRRAVELGLDPVRAVRFATINAAVRLRLHDVGAIAPGMKADIQLADGLDGQKPDTVICGGAVVVEGGRYLPEHAPRVIGSAYRRSVQVRQLSAADFRLECRAGREETPRAALVNVISQDGRSTRTKRKQVLLPLAGKEPGRFELVPGPLVRMAVINRYGRDQIGLALIDNLDDFKGAVALTYSHDCHNLVVYGSDEDDMVLAANTVAAAGGGIAAVRGSNVLAAIELPIAGILSEETPQVLLARLENFLDVCRRLGFRHEHPMLFFTIMALAVSPEIKCTDRGLLDVVNKQFLPLVAALET